MRYIYISVLSVLLSGCVTTPFDFFTKKPSIEANVNAGKNVEQDKSIVKVETGTTKQNADSISNDTAYTADTVNQITNNLTWWQMLVIILCAGAALPSFKEMYAGLKIVIGDILYTFIVYPFKGIRDFVLLTLGKL